MSEDWRYSSGLWCIIEVCTLHYGIVRLIQINLLGREVGAQALFGSSSFLPLHQPHKNALRRCRVIVPSISVLMPELFLISAVNQTLLHLRLVDSSTSNCCDGYPICPIPFTFTRCNMEGTGKMISIFFRKENDGHLTHKKGKRKKKEKKRKKKEE